MKLSNSLHYTKTLRKYISHLNNIKIHIEVQSFTASLVLLRNRTNSIANYIPTFSSTHALLLSLKFQGGGGEKNAKFNPLDIHCSRHSHIHSALYDTQHSNTTFYLNITLLYFIMFTFHENTYTEHVELSVQL